MKRYIICIVLSVLVFTVSAFAIEEGDYGYYDVTADGKVEIVDVLGILKEYLNGDGDLIRVVKALKLTSSNKVITATITDIDESSNTVTMFFGNEQDDDYLTVPMHKIGFNAYYHRDFFLEGIVTMTVSGDFATAKDISLIHAAEASCRYDVCRIELTEGAPMALVNGVAESITAPAMIDGEIFVDAAFLGDKLEHSIEGDTVCAREVAESLGAKVTFDEESKTLVIVKMFLPTFVLSEVNGKAGETVSTVLSFVHNPGIAGIQVHIGYDSKTLTYKSAKTNSIKGMLVQVSPKEGANPFKYVAANMNLANVYGDLTLSTVDFAISENAESGSYSLVFSNVKLYDSTLCNLRCDFKSANVNITK